MSIVKDRYGIRNTDLRDKELEESRDERIAEINKKFKEGGMSKQYIITQAELDMLEAIRLDIYNIYVKDDSIDDIIKAGTVTQPLWQIINKKRQVVHD